MSTDFGKADGSRGPISEDHQFIHLDTRFGAIGRPIDEYTRTRVVVGSQGVGKTLFLRRLQAHFEKDDSVLSARAVLETSELDTNTVIRFSQLFRKSANSENWTFVWKCAIYLAASRAVLADHPRWGAVPEDVISHLTELLDDLLPDATYRNPVDITAFLTRGISGNTDWDRFRNNSCWIDLRETLRDALKHSREVYLFLDAIDDNFKYAPSYWMQCQRGLFYAVMHAMRNDTIDNKLHVVISIRDLVFTSVLQSEHGRRYASDVEITPLTWTTAAAVEFLGKKVAQLSPDLFPHSVEPSITSFLGREAIWNEQRDMAEPIEQYLIRHTKLSPRDIILLGNGILIAARRENVMPQDLSDAVLRRAVSLASRLAASEALAQVANQVVTNALPWNSSKFNYTESMTTEYDSDGLVREICSVLLLLDTELFDRDVAARLSAEADKRFGSGANLLDVLWQHRLIGVLRDGGASFYDGVEDGRFTLPDGPLYILHSILLDVLPTVEVMRHEIHYPGEPENVNGT